MRADTENKPITQERAFAELCVLAVLLNKRVDLLEDLTKILHERITKLEEMINP